MQVEPHQQAPSNVHRLQPLRVHLSASDRRFLRVTSFLLARRGYHVTQSAPGSAAGAAERERADVVVLESGKSRAATAKTIAALAALRSAPSVVVVTDDGALTRWGNTHTVEKWTPLDSLVGKIEAASRTRPNQLADE